MFLRNGHISHSKIHSSECWQLRVYVEKFHGQPSYFRFPNKNLKFFLGKKEDEQRGAIEFDFLVCGEVLRIPLSEHLEEHSVSTEVTAEVEYFERVPAPEPQDCLLHDDWVSAVQVKDGW